MSWILVLRDPVSNGETYFESGTGFVATKSAATAYSSKEAGLVDGVTQRESLGAGARLAIVDLVSGAQFPVPNLDKSPYINTILVTPATPSIAHAGTQQMQAIGVDTAGRQVNITGTATWASATPATATVAPGGLVTGVAAGTTVISASQAGAIGSTTLTAT